MHGQQNIRAEEAFTKWPSGIFPTPVQALAEVHKYARGLLRRKFCLKDCTVYIFHN